MLIASLNTLEPLFYNGFFLVKNSYNTQFAQNITLFFGLKMVMTIGLLILIRGGTPRYRYDYLTKLGWLKFIGLIILVLVSAFLLFFIF